MALRTDIENKLHDYKLQLKALQREDREASKCTVVHWEKQIRLRCYIRMYKGFITDLSLILGRNSPSFDNVKIG